MASSHNSLMVLKIGGGEVDDPEYLKKLGRTVAAMTASRKLLLVHGGGKEIGRMIEQLGGKTAFHEGLRITDELAIQVVEMVLSGLVNKRIVGALVAAGVKALGLSGRDLALVRAKKLEAEVDLGQVGEPEKINGRFLQQLLELELLPVISPVGQGADGRAYNINADHVARAVAVAMRAEELVFLSNVPCVYDDTHQLSRLNSLTANGLIASGVIGGGMIPKVRSGLEALEHGIKKVIITDLEGLEQYLRGRESATVITR